MGGTQSTGTRKITIPNEENLIKVSDSVAERLKKCQDSPSKPDKEKCACKTDELHAQVRVGKENVGPGQPVSGDALINYYYGPSLTSIRVLQEKEKELKETEKYWSQRIQHLEEHHSQLSRIMEQEYDKSLKDITCQVPRKPSNTPQPCVEGKKKLLDCYKRHPNQSLLCAQEVSDFANCVHTQRINSTIGSGCSN